MGFYTQINFKHVMYTSAQAKRRKTSACSGSICQFGTYLLVQARRSQLTSKGIGVSRFFHENESKIPECIQDKEKGKTKLPFEFKIVRKLITPGTWVHY